MTATKEPECNTLCFCVLKANTMNFPNKAIYTAQGWQAECNTAGESVLMCDGNQIQSL
jgi:hypothetical protein